MKEFLFAFLVFLVLLFGAVVYRSSQPQAQACPASQEKVLQEEIARLKKDIKKQKQTNQGLNAFMDEYFIAWQNCKSQRCR